MGTVNPMAREPTSNASGRDGNSRTRRPTASLAERHEHRTAKVIELVGSSPAGFEEAVRTALADAAATTRGITGAQVTGWSVKCDDGEVVEYKATIKVAFGVERT